MAPGWGQRQASLAVLPPCFIIGRTAKPSRRRRPVSATLGVVDNNHCAQGETHV